MKQKLSMVLAMMVLASALVLTGCMGNPHTGPWTASQVEIGGETLSSAEGLGAQMTLMLQDGDGMALVITDETDPENPTTERGHWKASGNILTLTFDVTEKGSQLEGVVMEGTFEGRTLTLENWMGTGMTLTFSKGNAA